MRYVLQIHNILLLKFKRKLGALCTKIDLRSDLVSLHGVIWTFHYLVSSNGHTFTHCDTITITSWSAGANTAALFH